MSNSLTSLRKQLRLSRKQLSRYEQQKAERQLLTHIRNSPQFKAATKIGLYLHAFGEVHTRNIMQLCFQQHKQVYLPMICNMNQKLVWIKISSNQLYNRRFSHHALGMKEPMSSRGYDVSHLDLLVMPLLACDQRGTRLGMGGGFYDRTLASAPHRPFRMGLAHQFQYIEHNLVRQNWDQPLDGLVTPKKIYYFKR